MLGSIDDVNKNRIQAVFASKYQAAEDMKLTNQGFTETFNEIADKIGVKTEELNKAYSDFVLLQTKPEVREGKDAIMSLVFNA